MGRFLSGTGGSSATGGGIFKLKAGAALLQDAILQIGPNGLVFPVAVADYAAVANCNYGTTQTSEATGRIVPHTTISAYQAQLETKFAVVQGSDGSIFYLGQQAVGGLRLTRYSASGALTGYVDIDSTGSQFSYCRLLLLSNGNLAAVAYNGGGPYATFAVIGQDLNIIKSATNTEFIYSTYTALHAISLAGGGFAILYQPNAAPLTSKLATFDNSGNAVLAATTVRTGGGTISSISQRMIQLSSGDIAIAVSSQNPGGAGLFHGVVTTAGVTVKAFESIDSYSNSQIPEITAAGGFYAVARMRDNACIVGVFSNTGVQQGAIYSATTSANTGRIKLLNDDIAFWLIYPDNSSGQKTRLAKIPATATGIKLTDITTNNYNQLLDAFCDGGFIVLTTQDLSSAGITSFSVVSTLTGMLVSTSPTQYGGIGSATPGANNITIIPGGDFSFISVYAYASPASVSFCVGKYANTAVIGVAAEAATKDALIAINGLAGAYTANEIKGSISKQFDHSAANIFGNKGVMLRNGAVLKGV